MQEAKKELANKHLTDPSFNAKTKNAMLRALFKAGIIKDPNDPRWLSMTAEEAAKMLHDAGLDPSKIDDPELRAAVELAGHIARGDSDAARQLVAHSTMHKEEHERKRREEIQRVQESLAGKTLADPKFASEVKDSMLAAMIAAGIISGPDDPKWHTMSAEQAAKLLSESDLDPSKVSDPAVRRALLLAKRIASGDHSAAQELVAHHRVHHEEQVKAAMKKYAGKTLEDPHFNGAVKQSMMAAMMAAGLISGPNDPKWLSMSAQDAAKALAASGLDPSKVSDPAVRKALLLAKRIAAGDLTAARELVAHHEVHHERHKRARRHAEVQEAKKELANKHLTDPSFNAKTKNAMLRALFKAGIIKDPNDPRWLSMTAEEAAKMLHDAGLDPSKIDDPELRAAVELAGHIARGDSDAARQLVAHSTMHKEEHERKRREEIQRVQESLAGKTLADPKFASEVKDSMLAAMIAAGIISGPDDPKWHTMSAEQAAKLLSESDLDPSKVSDPAVRRALLLAKRIASGDHSAAQELVAHHRVHHEEQVKAAMKKYAGKTLEDPQFNGAVKQSMMAAMMAAGLISGPNDPKWLSMSAQDAAKALAASGLDPSQVSDPAVRKALLLAKRIAEGDLTAARELVAHHEVHHERHKRARRHAETAEHMKELKGKTLADPKFASEVKDSMLAAMIAAGIISGPDDPKWHTMSAEQAAKLLSESDLDPSKVSDPAVRRALLLAKRIASGDHSAAQELVAHHRVHHEEQVKTAMKKYAGKTLEDPQFNGAVKQSMLKAMMAAGLISGPNDPKWLSMSAQDAAKALAASGLDPSKVSDPAVRKALLLAKRIAAGDLDAARELVAHHEVHHERHKRARRHAETAEHMKELKGKTLADPKFASEVKDSMLAAMIAAGIISGPDDPKWHTMSAEQAAKLLSESDLDPSKVSDPAVRRALLLAKRIASGDHSAAQELVAHHRVHHEEQVQAAMKKYAGKTLEDPQFNGAVKQSMMAAMMAAGLISGPNDPKWLSMSAQDAAKALAASGLDPSKVSDPAVRKALLLAKRIAAGDLTAARELVAHHEVHHERHKRARRHAEVQEAKKELANKHLTDPSFNAKTKNAMLRALFKAGIIKDPNDPRWLSMTAEEAAKMLHDAGLDPSKIDDPELRAAVELAGHIARGDSDAARQLVAHSTMHKEEHERKRREEIQRVQESLAGKTLADPKFASEVKDSMLAAMIAAGIISGPDDPKWHTMSAEQAAKLLSESDLDPSKVSDPAVRRALLLAKRIASGDHTAAQELVAHHRVHHEEQVQSSDEEVCRQDTRGPAVQWCCEAVDDGGNDGSGADQRPQRSEVAVDVGTGCSEGSGGIRARPVEGERPCGAQGTAARQADRRGRPECSEGARSPP